MEMQKGRYDFRAALQCVANFCNLFFCISVTFELRLFFCVLWCLWWSSCVPPPFAQGLHHQNHHGITWIVVTLPESSRHHQNHYGITRIITALPESSEYHSNHPHSKQQKKYKCIISSLNWLIVWFLQGYLLYGYGGKELYEYSVFKPLEGYFKWKL